MHALTSLSQLVDNHRTTEPNSHKKPKHTYFIKNAPWFVEDFPNMQHRSLRRRQKSPNFLYGGSNPSKFSIFWTILPFGAALRRGLMIDTGRHYLSKMAIKRQVNDAPPKPEIT